MNTVTASNGSIKRTRFDLSIFQGSTIKRQPTKAPTLAFFKLHTASLQGNLPDTLNNNSTKHVTHHHCIREKTNQHNRFDKDKHLIPKSDRIDFKFHVYQEAEQSEEFEALKEDTYQIITNFQKSLK